MAKHSEKGDERSDDKQRGTKATSEVTERSLDAERLLRFCTDMYHIEFQENIEVWRRAGFLVSALVIIGTVSGALVKTANIFDGYPRVASVIYLIIIVALFAFLFASAITLMIAMQCRDFQFFGAMRAYFDPHYRPDGEDADPIDGPINESRVREMMKELARTRDLNTDTNIARFKHLAHATMAMAIAAALLGIQAIVHALTYLITLA